ncbi:hypothetical protein ACFV9C_12815 [Kribbella sp. NPDC059898]|uniref:hypothetical protein n=1 Tax=Kribbella sp. NPDC059898 TaxID=3346995 RepID=UPI00366720D5
MTMQGDRRTRPGRTLVGTAWRTVVVLAAAAGAIAAAGWLGSHLIGYDDRLAMVPAVPAAFLIGILTIGYLRARIGFIAVPLLGTLVAALGGAVLLHSQIRRSGSFHATYDDVLFAIGVAAALVSIVVAAVDGHRRPRDPVADTSS